MSVRTARPAAREPAQPGDRLAAVLAAGIAQLDIGGKTKGKQPALKDDLVAPPQALDLSKEPDWWYRQKEVNDWRRNLPKARTSLAGMTQEEVDQIIRDYRKEFTPFVLAKMIAREGYLVPTKEGFKRRYLRNEQWFKSKEGEWYRGPRDGEKMNPLEIMAELEGAYVEDPLTGIGRVMPSGNNEASRAIAYKRDELVDRRYMDIPVSTKKRAKRAEAMQKAIEDAAEDSDLEELSGPKLLPDDKNPHEEEVDSEEED